MKLELYNNRNHVMLDIETLSTSMLPVVTQICAIQFNPVTGETFEEFGVKLDLQSCLDLGLKVDEGALKFWSTQDPEVYRDVVFLGTREDVKKAFIKFSKFLEEIEDVNLWGKGPSFDIAKLGNIFELLSLKKPWSFRNEKCVRTILTLNTGEVNKVEFKGDKHNAIDDCKHQIKQVNAVFKTL